MSGPPIKHRSLLEGLTVEDLPSVDVPEVQGEDLPMTFDRAQDEFRFSPSPGAAGAYLREAMEYEADDMIGDDTFGNALAEIRDYLLSTNIASTAS